MRLEPISQKSKAIIDSIRDAIRQGQTEHVMENSSGWRYGGEILLKLVVSLRDEIKEELQGHGVQVLACTVRRFNRGANIHNRYYPTKRLIIIPINGDSTISPDDRLPVDTYCYIEGVPTLHGEHIDVVVVAYEVKPQNA